MFEQYIGDGANLFITIVAIIIGFMAALTVIDFKGSSSNEQKEEESHR